MKYKSVYKVEKLTVSYKNLWKLLIDRDMKKKNLQVATGISPFSIARLSKFDNVSMDVLIKVCTALNVGLKILQNWYRILINNDAAIRFMKHAL